MLQPLTPVTTPFGRVGIDTLEPFRRSRQGNKKIIVATDYMTRWAVARAVPRENAVEIANMMISDIFLVHGAPQEILTDRGMSFRALLRIGLICDQPYSLGTIPIGPYEHYFRKFWSAEMHRSGVAFWFEFRCDTNSIVFNRVTGAQISHQFAHHT